MMAGVAVKLRQPSAALRREQAALESIPDSSVRKRIGWIWGLLYVNVLPYSVKSPLLHMPVTAGKVVTQGALIVAVILAMSINKKALMRPNLFLVLMTILCITTAVMSVRGYYGHGSMLRAGRLILFVLVLWLLTPWWGRRDLLLLRFHRRALYVVLGVVLLGMMIMPGYAFAQGGGGRLGGVIWSIPPTQVAHYAAILVGTTVVLWFAELIRPRTAALVSVAGVTVLLLTHTRTALIALLLGILVAALSLFLSRQRVRKAVGITVVIGALMALSFAPFLTSWFARGESTKELLSFTGRETVWAAIAEQPRSELNTLLGYGMSNDSFNGLSIDSSWYSAYVNQGQVGDIIDAIVLLTLFLIAILSPRGPRRALALFIVVYCTLASFTETGLGEASPYLLDLAVAMSVLMAPTTPAPPGDPPIEPLFS